MTEPCDACGVGSRSATLPERAERCGDGQNAVKDRNTCLAPWPVRPKGAGSLPRGCASSRPWPLQGYVVHICLAVAL
eukprot:2791917-Heterocapsa_arctica.AAC.1